MQSSKGTKAVDTEQPLILIVGADDGAASPAGRLAGAGFEVRVARDGQHALSAIADALSPDLVILDAELPQTDGFHVCAIIKGDPRTRSIPVILITLASAVEDRVRAMEVGADDFLEKPVDPEELLARVRALLRVKAVYDEMAAEIQRMTQIGIALSAEHNLSRLLERIVDEARSINRADAGTLYAVDRDAGVLRAEILQNESMGTRIGGEHGEQIQIPPVPLNPAYISAYVALTGQIVNIPDVYEAEGFDFSGPRKYDAVTGYRSRSMLVVPMRNHEDEVIGVLQLINAQDPETDAVVPFYGGNVERTRSLASQAGIALTNARLINDLEAFLEGLIQVMATAVDEKSHYTSGHIQRVTSLSVLLGEAVSRCADERFGGKRFSADELKELRIAGLLHDIGKIVVPEHVVDKATKLQCVYDRIEEIRTRFSLIGCILENQALRRKLELACQGASAADLNALDAELRVRLTALEEDLEFLTAINSGGEFMAPEKLERLHGIAAHTYLDEMGVERPYLTEDEVENLSIARGTLLPREFETIRNHARVTSRLLGQIPFSRKLRNVPVYAGDHHEALNGTGYPAGKSGEEISLQARILAIADIYDALTSSDRPYKKAYSPEVAYRILREDAARGKLDARLVEVFVEAASQAPPHPTG